MRTPLLVDLRNVYPPSEAAREAAEGADAVVLVTEWDAFRALDLGRLARGMRTPLLVDLRNVYPPSEAARAGLKLVSIGRAPAEQA